MSFMFRDRKDTEFDYGNNEDFGQMKRMKYYMCVHYRDNGATEKKKFDSVLAALDWFEDFKMINQRLVTVTFYDDVSPRWVYYINEHNYLNDLK